MKSEFSKTIENIGKKDKKLFFLTGDLGFNAFENIATQLKNRFINAGVAEQNMVSIAAGMAKMGFRPWVYSIATFLTLKTYEQVRNDVALLNLPVKFAGNGGGYGYGIMGETHHALEDISIYTSLENMICYIPAFTTDVETIMRKMHKKKNPSYIRLTSVPVTKTTSTAYAPLRKIISGGNVTVVVLGPLVHEVLNAVLINKKYSAIDLFCLSELPLHYSLNQINDSLRKTQKLILLEEHRKEGGLGEKLFYEIVKKNIIVKEIIHLYAKGYPSGRYGSRSFHLAENQLDAKGFMDAFDSVV